MEEQIKYSSILGETSCILSPIPIINLTFCQFIYLEFSERLTHPTPPFSLFNYQSPLASLELPF